MVALFASLPSLRFIKPERMAMAQRLLREWMYFVARTRALRKVFLSVKGVYFQAEVKGVPVTWLQPGTFPQVMPSDVDFRVMLTFPEFHETLLEFVGYKLYHGVLADTGRAAGGRNWAGVEGKEEATATREKHRRLVQFQSLFKGLIFFLGREVPRAVFEFAIVALHGRVGWDAPGLPYAAGDARITHHVIDRPMAAGAAVPGRDYVQPQWVADSINARMLPIACCCPLQSTARGNRPGGHRAGAYFPPFRVPLRFYFFRRSFRCSVSQFSQYPTHCPDSGRDSPRNAHSVRTLKAGNFYPVIMVITSHRPQFPYATFGRPYQIYTHCTTKHSPFNAVH
jgi:hypothetical protein